MTCPTRPPLPHGSGAGRGVRRAGRRGDPEAGSVTVEAAVALSALLVVLALCLAAIGAVVTQVRLTDAAGAAARLAARGDPDGARAAVAAAAGAAAVLELESGGLVTARVAVPPWGGLLPGLRLSAVAVAAVEPPLVAP